jgi:hypothetical protein
MIWYIWYVKKMKNYKPIFFHPQTITVMKKQLLLIACAASLILSCSKTKNETLAANPLAANSSVRSAARAANPFTGSITYQFSTEFDLPCDCGSFYPGGNFFGTGNFSHLGLSTSKIKPCLSPVIVDGVQTGNHVGVECASFVAANGDEVYLHTHPYDLMFVGPATAAGACNVDIVGGTGRFATATGSFTGLVTVYFATGTATMTDVNGAINY